jgi:hypothetical protein
MPSRRIHAHHWGWVSMEREGIYGAVGGISSFATWGRPIRAGVSCTDFFIPGLYKGQSR